MAARGGGRGSGAVRLEGRVTALRDGSSDGRDGILLRVRRVRRVWRVRRGVLRRAAPALAVGAGVLDVGGGQGGVVLALPLAADLAVGRGRVARGRHVVVGVLAEQVLGEVADVAEGLCLGGGRAAGAEGRGAVEGGVGLRDGAREVARQARRQRVGRRGEAQ